MIARDTIDRRNFLIGSAATATTLIADPAWANDYPTRPITIINPFPPGGASDVVTRPLAAALEPIVKQAVVIETKAGAAGAVGAQVAGAQAEFEFKRAGALRPRSLG